jgi:uncharacterized coiled-coil protein SlyX
MTNRGGSWLLSGLAALLIAALAGNLPAPRLQADNAERLGELETVVAEQDDEVDDLRRDLRRLERRVETVEASLLPDTAANRDLDQGAAGEAGSGTADAVTFTGTGPSATEPFVLTSGSYRLEASCNDGFLFALDIQRIDAEEFVISTLIGSPPYSGSEVLTVDGGRYVFSVTCEGNWTVSATRLLTTQRDTYVKEGRPGGRPSLVSPSLHPTSKPL